MVILSYPSYDQTSYFAACIDNIPTFSKFENDIFSLLNQYFLSMTRLFFSISPLHGSYLTHDFRIFLLAIAETEDWQGTLLVGHPPHRVSFVLACK